MAGDLRVGVRVRVVGHPSYEGAVGTIEKDPDEFGRFGLRLDDHLRWQQRAKKSSWRHQPVWFAAEALERMSPQCEHCNDTGYVHCGDRHTGQSYRCDEWGRPCPVLTAHERSTDTSCSEQKGK